jgi:hypothetical protein
MRFRSLPVGFLLSTLTVAPAASAGAGGEATRDEQSAGKTTGTTVIIHGFQLSESVPDWTFHLAEAIRERAGGGRIYQYHTSTGDLVPCSHPACGPQSEAGEAIIVFDWAAASNASGAGFSEAAAESLVAGLVKWSRADPPLTTLNGLHLLGHSRGAVVASEAAERLIAAGLPPPDRVTNLDPHDGGAFGLTDERREPEGLWDDLDVNELHPEYLCSTSPGEPSGVCAWRGVGHNENYWRDQDAWPCLLDPDGRPVPGASEFDGSSLDSFCHSDVHSWYYFTVDIQAATHPETGDPPGLDWFDPSATTCETPTRSWPLARTIDGFNSSRVGGGEVRCPDDPVAQQRVRFDFNLAEGLVNGDFEKPSDGSVLAGWQFHGGGGTAHLDTGSGSHLLLDAGEWRQHNRFLTPDDTLALSFCRSILMAGAGDPLTITLHHDGGSRVLHAEEPTATTGWQCFTVAMEAQEAGRACTLEIELGDDGAAPAARIGVDDIALVVGIFIDGFESGNTDHWSAVNPQTSLTLF